MSFEPPLCFNTIGQHLLTCQTNSGFSEKADIECNICVKFRPSTGGKPFGFPMMLCSNFEYTCFCVCGVLDTGVNLGYLWRRVGKTI